MIAVNRGQVLTDNGWSVANVLIADGKIAALTGEPLSADLEIDAGGCLVGPGFVDLHVHLREPGQTDKEDIHSGIGAAATGGFTAIVAMPNTVPATDNVETVKTIRSIAASVGDVEVGVAAAMTKDRRGEERVPIADLYQAGVRMFTDDGDAVVDQDLLRAIMSEIAEFPGALVSQHAEDPSLIPTDHPHEESACPKPGICEAPPREAEFLLIERDIELARETGAHYHCQHLSTAEAVDLVEKAKSDGLDVTAEVTPHHLSFTEEDVNKLGANLKTYPPVRTGRDRERLRDGLRAGVIDAIATDHAPHTVAEKGVEFASAPRGAIGLETAAGAAWEILEDAPERFFEVMSVAPARIAGLTAQGSPLAPGVPANVVVFDPGTEWQPQPPFRSKAENSPYIGRNLKGRVKATIYQGRASFKLRESHV